MVWALSLFLPILFCRFSHLVSCPASCLFPYSPVMMTLMCFTCVVLIFPCFCILCVLPYLFRPCVVVKLLNAITLPLVLGASFPVPARKHSILNEVQVHQNLIQVHYSSRYGYSYFPLLTFLLLEMKCVPCSMKLQNLLIVVSAVLCRYIACYSDALSSQCRTANCTFNFLCFNLKPNKCWNNKNLGLC